MSQENIIDNKVLRVKKSGISANMTRKMSKRGFVGKKKKQYPSKVSDTINFIFDKKDRIEFKKQTEEIIQATTDLTNIVYSLRSIMVMCSLTLSEPIENNFIQTEDSTKWKELIKFGEQLKPVLEKCIAVNESLKEVKSQIRIDKALKIIVSKIIEPLNYIQNNLPQIVISCNEFAPKYIDDIRALGTEESASVCTYIETILPYLVNGTSVKTNSALVRKRIRDTRMKVEEYQSGVRSNTTIQILYIEDLVHEELLEEVKNRLEEYKIDGILDSGMLEQLTEKPWYSPFRSIR